MELQIFLILKIMLSMYKASVLKNKTLLFLI